ncbi:hypothetical protein D3C71_1552750 [compost metagenome]
MLHRLFIGVNVFYEGGAVRHIFGPASELLVEIGSDRLHLLCCIRLRMRLHLFQLINRTAHTRPVMIRQLRLVGEHPEYDSLVHPAVPQILLQVLDVALGDFAGVRYFHPAIDRHRRVFHIGWGRFPVRRGLGLFPGTRRCGLCIFARSCA